MTEKTTAWAIYYPKAGTKKKEVRVVCQCEVTAIRMAEVYNAGKDPRNFAEVNECLLYFFNGETYGPISLTTPSPDDIRAQLKIDRRRVAEGKAKALGLTDADIEDLR